MRKILNVFKFMHQNGRRFLLMLYTPLYLLCFTLLESSSEHSYHVIHCPIDNMIPFCEVFIIPYFGWFIYMTFGLIFTIFQKNGRDFYHMATALFFGMTFFIIISYAYPNMLDLRPTVFPRHNFLTQLVADLYFVDTPTNVFPSIHVFNSVVIHHGMCRCDKFKTNPIYKHFSFVFTVLIILSTLFLKQHSVIDAGAGLLLALAMYPICYSRWSGWLVKIWRKYDPKHY